MISELDFRRQLVGPRGLATMLGWVHVHFRPAMTQQGWRTAGSGELAKGWPDLFLLRERDGRRLAVELKRQDGMPTPEQTEVLRILGACGIPAMVWRPSDLPEIQELLR